MSFFLSNSFRRTLCLAHRKGPSIKYVCKFYQKSACAYQGVKNSTFWVNFSVFQSFCRCIDDVCQSNYYANIQREHLVRFGSKLQRCVRKPILSNLGTQIFKKLSPVTTVVVPPGVSNINKLLTVLVQE